MMNDSKSLTDRHWDQRATTVEQDVDVNITDVYQRELEYDYICKYLAPTMRVLEVGCGNGFSTQRFRSLVAHVDAFDFSARMIDRARLSAGETNNTFFVDNVLNPQHLSGKYDLTICVRVLINLRNLQEQLTAVRSMSTYLKSGGLLIIAEGFHDGFDNLTALRQKVGLPPVAPAKVNCYSSLSDFRPVFAEQHLVLHDAFHLGAYDFLTRIVYPLIVGVENAKHNTAFSKSCSEIARVFNPDIFEELSRLRGLVLRKQ